MPYDDNLKFAILGPMEVQFRGHEIPVRGWREQQVLAALVLAAGYVASMDRLVATVWEADPPQFAAKAVRNSVSSLRRRFADAGAPASVLRTEPSGYRLLLDDCYLDADDFRTRVINARLAAATGQAAEAATVLRTALALWRGHTLAGLSGAVIEAGAASLNEQRLTAVEECLELELVMGKHREMISELRALTGEHPLRERFAGQLMIALYRSGRQAEALDVYRQLATVLADSLGIDPAKEIAGLHEAILRQDRELSMIAGCDEPAFVRLSQPTGAGPGPELLESRGPRGHQSACSESSERSEGRARQSSRGWRIPLVSAASVGAIAMAGAYALSSSGAAPANTGAGSATSVTAARDNTDPYAAGCRPDEKAIATETVYWPGGRQFGTLILYYSPACQAAWGYLAGPNSTAWTIHIIPGRPSSYLSIPWQFSGDQESGSWSNVLSTIPGCVYVEAFVSSKAGIGPSAKTPCFTGTNPEVRQQG